MCAIAGQIAKDAAEIEKQSASYDAMQETMTRRGPDSSGRYIDCHAALLHARLCVVDIQNGAQPMHLTFDTRELVLVYNGELYNTPELKAELAEHGHHFIGHSDTEVVLHGYAEWGEQCVEKFNGIFAFAVWDKMEKRLFVARDRMGVKPFFYVHRNGSFLFASEIKTLLRHTSVEPIIDLSGLAEIMLLGPGRTPGCGVFKDVYELLPGECGFYDAHTDRFQKRIYWALTDREHNESFSQTVEHVRFLVTDSIERQLVSDVPVCTFLSGGLDSSLISSVANRCLAARGEALHTVSLDYRGNDRYFHADKFQPNSDSTYIACMNDYLGAENHRIVLDTPELVPALYRAVEARDLPGMADVDGSLLLFCAEIKKIATVALSGECADEIFGGYPWFRDKEIREREGFPWAQSTAYRAGFWKEEFAHAVNAAEFVDSRYRQTVADTDVLAGTSDSERRMKQMTLLNNRWFMQTLLDRKDRMSMYNSLEVRVPFCDYRIAEYLYSVPWEFKDYRGYEKGLLREAARGLLPDEVLWRKKSPYP
ncbi:MAG: asparagine synthase (glutamine-hydrolyzing), partial [Eubacteriales bacterium]